jgi:hypothetical protein
MLVASNSEAQRRKAQIALILFRFEFTEGNEPLIFLSMVFNGSRVEKGRLEGEAILRE